MLRDEIEKKKLIIKKKPESTGLIFHIRYSSHEYEITA